MDGVEIIDDIANNVSGANHDDIMSINYIYPVAAGTHLVQMFFNTSVGNMDVEAAGSHMHVRELL